MIRAILAGLLVAVSASADPALLRPEPRPDAVGRLASVRDVAPLRDGGPCCAYRASLVRVKDGDTAVFDIRLGFNLTLREPVRFEGIDTPEIRGASKVVGLDVSSWVRTWLETAERIVIVTGEDCERDKYGRVLARVWADGLDLTAILLETGRGVEETYPC